MQVPFFLVEIGIYLFEKAINEFSTEGAHLILLQIFGVSCCVAPPSDIKLTELNSILRVIEKHFRKANNVEKIYHNMELKVIEKQYEKNKYCMGIM